MIRQQIRNRARHSRYRRVLTGGRRGLLGKRWNSRDSRKQDRGHCPFDTVIQSFHCDSSCKLIPPTGCA